MKTNQLHINLSKCAHMYFRPYLHYKERLSCARTTGYDQGFSLSVMDKKLKKLFFLLKTLKLLSKNYTIMN